MLSNYSFSSGNSRDGSNSRTNGQENSSPLELTEKEMQDLADSISPIHSLDSLNTLIDQETGESSAMINQRQQRNIEQNKYYREPSLYAQINRGTKRPASSASEDTSIAGVKMNNGKSQSDAAKERRRERNRLLAKKTRVKNKAEVENLKREIEYLRSENAQLKITIQELLGSKPSTSTYEMNDTNGHYHMSEPIMLAVKEIVTMMEGNGASNPNESSYQRSFCISNALAQGNPTLYRSQNYVKMAEQAGTFEQSSSESSMGRSRSTIDHTTDSSSSFGPQSDDSGEMMNSELGSGSSGSGSDDEQHSKKAA